MNSALANLPEAQRRVLELAYSKRAQPNRDRRALGGTARHGENENARGNSTSKSVLENQAA